MILWEQAEIYILDIFLSVFVEYISNDLRLERDYYPNSSCIMTYIIPFVETFVSTRCQSKFVNQVLDSVTAVVD